MLRAGAGYTDMVRLLECVAPQVWERDLPRENDYRGRVHLRRRDTRYGIRRGRTGSTEHHARLAGRPRVAVSHVGCALLVPGKNVP